jgi:hypothetical protein
VILELPDEVLVVTGSPNPSLSFFHEMCHLALLQYNFCSQNRQLQIATISHEICLLKPTISNAAAAIR